MPPPPRRQCPLPIAFIFPIPLRSPIPSFPFSPFCLDVAFFLHQAVGASNGHFGAERLSGLGLSKVACCLKTSLTFSFTLLMDDFPPPGFDEVIASGGNDASANDTQLDERVREWRSVNARRYAVVSDSRTTLATLGKQEAPAEYLRKIVKDRGDMSDPKYRDQRRLFVGAMRYIPHALFKLFENMPAPWEAARQVDVVYHVAGALTIVSTVPSVVEPVYVAQWASAWTAMRREKKNRAVFQRVTEVPFHDEEAPFDFGDHLLDLDPPNAVQLELDEEEDAALCPWFYDHRPDTIASPNDASAEKQSFIDWRRRRWQASPSLMATLKRVGDALQPDTAIDDYNYCFDYRSFANAKAMNVSIPGGPKFHTNTAGGAGIGRREDVDDDDWTEFGDLNKIIVRQPLGTEVKLSYPFLYCSRLDADVMPMAAAVPASALIPVDVSPDAPLFRFHPIFNPVKSVPQPSSERMPVLDAIDDEPLDLPEDFAPLFDDQVLVAPDSKAAFSLLWSQRPFAVLKGCLSRPVDCPLVDSWYGDRCPRDKPVKVHRSYQHLLKQAVLVKQHALNSGRHRRTEHRVIDQLAGTKFFQRTRIEWLEAGLQLMRQGHTMLKLFLQLRNHNFVHIDFNFNARPTRVLTTKERKRSRLGQSFHLVRELLKLAKCVVDLHVRFRLGQIDA